MDFRDFYLLVVRNLFLVLLTTVLGVGVSAAITFSTTPKYESKIQLFVSTPFSAVDISGLAQGSSFSQQRVKSYAQIVNGPDTLIPVIRKLGLSDTYQQLAERVTATAPLDTVLINISVLDENPYQAADIATGIGEQFTQTVNSLEVTGTSGTQGIKVTTVKFATVPTTPATPKTNLNILLGLLLGFGVGIGASSLRIIFDKRIKNEEDLDSIQVLVAVPYDKSSRTKPLTTQISKYAPRTEAYRQLRANIQFSNSEVIPKTIAITSALPGEGKTTTAINTSLSFAAAGFKVLLIESDLRRPKVSSYLNLPKDKQGLTEILDEKILGSIEFKIQQTTQKWGDTNLYIISSGELPSNPAELLGSQPFNELIEISSQFFDYVFIDCPPTLLVADAAIVAAQCDTTMLVVKVASTRIQEFMGAKENLLSVGAKIIGCVMNMVPQSRTNEYGKRYGYNPYRNSYSYGKNYSKSTYGPKTSS